jgi:hypothetical protein
MLSMLSNLLTLSHLPALPHVTVDRIASWGPVALVILVAALSLTVAGAPPARRGTRRLWTAAIFVCGSLAVAGTVWQAQEILHRNAATLTLRRPGKGAVAGTARAAPQDRFAAAQQPAPARVVAPDTTAKLAAYLKKSGSHAVIVSAIPGDIEAYDYANQLVNLLHAADWQVGGPEITRVFGGIHAVGVNVFANPTQAGDTAKILIDAFRKFNIPYQPRVTPNGAVPASDAVELFVGALPGTRIAAAPARVPAAAPAAPIHAVIAGQGGGSTQARAGTDRAEEDRAEQPQ